MLDAYFLFCVCKLKQRSVVYSACFLTSVSHSAFPSVCFLMQCRCKLNTAAFSSHTSIYFSSQWLRLFYFLHIIECESRFVFCGSNCERFFFVSYPTTTVSGNFYGTKAKSRKEKKMFADHIINHTLVFCYVLLVLILCLLHSQYWGDKTYLKLTLNI
jgi:hypothetical protein